MLGSVRGNPDVIALKIPLSVCEFVPHLVHSSLGLPGVNIPNGISIGSAVFEELTVVTVVTERQTDRQT